MNSPPSTNPTPTNQQANLGMAKATPTQPKVETPPTTNPSLATPEVGLTPLLDTYRAASLAFTERGEELTIPRALAGTDDRAPGAWVTYLWQLPWKVARQGRKIKSDELRLLYSMPPLREPIGREGAFWSGKRQEERIGDSIANVESAMIQCVGKVMERQCKCCRKLLGPWAKCVQVEGAEGDLLACGNCRWNKQYRRCCFWKEGQAETSSSPRPGHRRGRSSQSSLDAEICKNAMKDLNGLCTDQARTLAQMKELVQEFHSVGSEGEWRSRMRELETRIQQLEDGLRFTNTQHDLLRRHHEQG
ncbi:hypothetical protein PENDEC_c014G02635 [Penicillium decumbens]|uniref:Uncharacterized protein n=1 Tax=Penicillium decumbens TaxID=69771 RepID=A0A1V6PAM0_PENDC|nr:hypothetical protein PENDEC_c014G02635 [Penicillium decumbens]